MLNRLPTPTQLPPLSLLLDDIGSPGADRLAKTFAVSRAEAMSWLRNDQAPRAVMLSLFWLTRWGRSVISAEATNDAAMAYGRCRALERELETERDRTRRLLQLGNFGSANAPMLGVSRASTGPGSRASPRSLSRANVSALSGNDP